MEAGAGAPRFDGQLTEAGLTGPAVVRRMLDQAAASKLNLLRMNAFAVDSWWVWVRQGIAGGSARWLPWFLPAACLAGSSPTGSSVVDTCTFCLPACLPACLAGTLLLSSLEAWAPRSFTMRACCRCRGVVAFWRPCEPCFYSCPTTFPASQPGHAYAEYT